MKYDYSQSIEFSTPLYVDHFSGIIPVKPMDDLWSFVRPLDSEVWLAFLITIPTFILAMGLSNYIFYNETHWGPLIDFVIREAMVEHLHITRYRFNRTFQATFAITWIWAMFFLTSPYSGNLMAMITRPSFQTPIKSVEDLIKQKDFTWMVPNAEGIKDYLEGSPLESPMRKLFDQGWIYNPKGTADEWWGCCLHTNQKYDGISAAICDSKCIEVTKNMDFSASGRCNYYSMRETFLTAPQVMALQKGNQLLNDDVNELLNLASQMGLVEGLFGETLKNGSKCDTWNDIQATHRGNEENVVLKLDDVKGMLILLIIGLGSSISVFIGEMVVHRLKKIKVSMKQK